MKINSEENSLGAWRKRGASQTEPEQYQSLNTRYSTSTIWLSISKVWHLGSSGQNFPGGIISSDFFRCSHPDKGSSSRLRQAVMTVVGACPWPLSSDGVTSWPSAQKKTIRTDQNGGLSRRCQLAAMIRHWALPRRRTLPASRIRISTTAVPAERQWNFYGTALRSLLSMYYSIGGRGKVNVSLSGPARTCCVLINRRDACERVCGCRPVPNLIRSVGQYEPSSL